MFNEIGERPTGQWGRIVMTDDLQISASLASFNIPTIPKSSRTNRGDRGRSVARYAVPLIRTTQLILSSSSSLRMWDSYERGGVLMVV
jgi:hypothetical protein